MAGFHYTGYYNFWSAQYETQVNEERMSTEQLNYPDLPAEMAVIASMWNQSKNEKIRNQTS